MKEKQNLLKMIFSSIQQGVELRTQPKPEDSLRITIDNGDPSFLAVYTWNSTTNSWKESGCVRKDPFEFMR